MTTKYEVYQMLQQEASKRGLKFETNGLADGTSSLNFVISTTQKDGGFAQGVLCESGGRNNPFAIWLGLKAEFFDFFEDIENNDYDPEKKKAFVIFVDEMLGPYFCIPYEVLKGEIRDKKNDKHPQKQFSIIVENGSYYLKRTKHWLNRYKDTLEPVFSLPYLSTQNSS